MIASSAVNLRVTQAVTLTESNGHFGQPLVSRS